MACEIVSSWRVVLVVWGKPELRDLKAIEREVKMVYEAFGPVIFIARVPPHAEAPEQHVREAIAQLLERFTEMCLSYHTVLEGSGFAVAAKRMVLSTIIMMTGRRNRYHVHSRCEEAALAVPAARRAEALRALRLFRVRGLLEREQPSRASIDDVRTGIG